MDLLVFLASLFLLGPFAKLLGRLGAGFTANDDTAARELALIILTSFVFYTVGAMLKRAPLHARVKSLPNPEYAGCLFLGWISLHLSLSILGAAAIAASFDAAPKAVPVTLMVALSISLRSLWLELFFDRVWNRLLLARSWPMELLADLLM
jgi:hypothetical protein